MPRNRMLFGKNQSGGVHTNTVYCPVIRGQIDGTTCLKIVDVADGLINARILEDIEAVSDWNDGLRQKCLNCPYHANIG